MSITVIVDNDATGIMQELAGRRFHVVKNFEKGIRSLSVDDMEVVMGKELELSSDRFKGDMSAMFFLDLSQVRIERIQF
jgi:hypothetical protein